MKLPAFLFTTVIGAAAAFSVQAAPPADIGSINVTIGAELQDKADKYGPRELDFLTSELVESVQRELQKVGGLSDSGARLDLVIEDARPNRPTMRQMSKTPGLSYQSRGVGGAEISGVLTTVDGRTIPVSYRWYESDLRNTVAAGTWSDAETSFDRFARKLARGEAVAWR